jgi:hypothetical protein
LMPQLQHSPLTKGKMLGGDSERMGFEDGRFMVMVEI